MADMLYQQARKLGLKDVKARQAKKQEPYLLALEELLPHAAALGEEDLGLVRIDLEQVVGTRSTLRQKSFSGSFYPLLDDNSEFAAKWSALAASHLEEGIRDPITVVEYLNRFYVVEGHKRVSVLRFFGAATVQANAMRLLPPRADEPEIVVYYEFLAFYRVTKANFIQFTHAGEYAELLELLGEAELPWDEERRRGFFADVTRFRRAYQAMKPAGAPPQDEALLRYLRIYGYEHLRERSPAELRSDLTSITPELLTKEEESDPLVMTGPEEPKHSLLKPLISTPRSVKVAFLHDKDPESSFWTYSHERGRLRVQETLGERVETTSRFHMLQEDFDKTVRELVDEGYGVVFTSTPKLLPQTLTAAALYPNVKFLSCSLNVNHPILRCYYPRMYEAKFLTGVIAGLASENGRIGYVCNYPVFSMPASINAFALGAKMVNPRAQVFLQWSTVQDSDVDARFAENGVTAVSGRDSFPPAERERELGLFLLNDGVRTNLAWPTWNWGVIYQKILESVLDGSWGARKSSDSGQTVNYWWGLSSGAVGVCLREGLPAQALALVKLLQDGIVKESFHPFAGPIYDQSGKLRIEKDELLSPGQILRMGWLVENVVGALPDPAQLTPEAQALVKIQGVAKE